MFQCKDCASFDVCASFWSSDISSCEYVDIEAVKSDYQNNPKCSNFIHKSRIAPFKVVDKVWMVRPLDKNIVECYISQLTQEMSGEWMVSVSCSKTGGTWVYDNDHVEKLLFDSEDAAIKHIELLTEQGK